MRTTLPWLLFLLGCGSATAMREDLDLHARIASVGGTVECIGGDGSTLVVAALAVGEDATAPLHVADYVLVHEASAGWSFLLPPGTYRFVAFEDVSGDVDYQPDERVAPWDEFRDVVLEPGSARSDIVLRIEGPAPSGEAMPVVAGPTGAERSLFVGDVVPLEDARFGMANGRMGMLEPQRFMEEVGSGLFFSEPYDPARTPIVFVHGISGYPQEFDEIVAGLDRSRYQVWIAQYASGFDLDLVSDYVARALDEVVTIHHPSAVCVVAHSMGGVVMRRAIGRYAAHAGRTRIPLFLTLASPLGGHPGAAMGAAMSPIVLPVWRSLVPSGPFISHLFDVPLPDETRRTLLFAFGSDDARGDGVVPLTSQLLPAAQAEADLVRGFPTSHVGILSDERSMALVHEELAAHCR